MIPIPAIDLKGGKVVRLLQGDFKAEKVYSEKVEEVAKFFTEEGARRIHVVDLDGALGGKPANQGLVEKILATTRVPIEVGGGIRDLKTANFYFQMGVRWVVLGTKACLDEGFAREAILEFGEKIIVGIDARQGLVATDGWTKMTTIKAVDFAKQIEKLQGKTIIYTDIAKDGALGGPNLHEIKALSEAVSINVIASGGISTLDDLFKIGGLKRPNIYGAVIGKALYEGKFFLRDAVKLCLRRE